MFLGEAAKRFPLHDAINPELQPNLPTTNFYNFIYSFILSQAG